MEDTYRSQFRLPYPLYEQLKEASEKAGRSLNAELVYRLSKSFAGDKAQDADQANAGHFAVEELADMLAHPENRAELEALLSTLQRLTAKDKPGKK